ncbi:MAG: XdhC family protein [Thermostichus sp. BF3_bins_97]
MEEAFYQELAAMLSAGPLVVATVIHTQGSVPRQVGAKLALGIGGTLAGTIGGGAGEAAVLAQAQALLQAADPVGRELTIDLTGSPLGVCGGRMQIWLQLWQGSQAQALVAQILQALTAGAGQQLVTPLNPPGWPYLSAEFAHLAAPQREAGSFIEPLTPAPTLLIIGAGHCGIPLAQVAHWAGFRIWVQDDRPEYATPERFPTAERLCPQAFSELIPDLRRIPQLYMALLTRGYTLDCQILRAIHQANLIPRYLGMIGSRKRVKTVLQTLAQEGIPAGAFPTLHAPIGLEIHAETPAEIAISITAQLIQVRRAQNQAKLPPGKKKG